MGFFEAIGGTKTLILAALAIAIAWYLHRLSKKEKQADVSARLTAETLAATPDEELVNAVVRDLLDSCERARQGGRLPWSAPDMYRMVAHWSNPQVNVYAVWVAVKEAENGGVAGMKASPSGAFFDLSADGFAQIGATACEAAFRAEDEAAFAAALAAEDPLNLCVEYIRDNADAFAEG
ncbi:MAG: hypothetical protein E7549_04545 [Ruminococcaceae bacterium]|nr:hypothetical protein [Oscillospiraceae bacterium]